MTVDELAQLLATYPPDLRVVVDGYEAGFDDLSPRQVRVVEIALGTGKNHWEGQHGEPNGLNEGTKIVDALLLRRVSN